MNSLNLDRKLNRKEKLDENEELRLSCAVLAKFIAEVAWSGKASKKAYVAAIKAIIALALLVKIDLDSLRKDLDEAL